MHDRSQENREKREWKGQAQFTREEDCMHDGHCPFLFFLVCKLHRYTNVKATCQSTPENEVCILFFIHILISGLFIWMDD